MRGHFSPRTPDLPVFGARVLGLFLCVRLTLTYLRHNLPQELLAELYGVWQATVSRVISTYTPLIAACLNGSAPTVEDLDPTAQLIIDGTLLQCWSWKDHSELYSGKHKTTGLNVQVACTLSGHPGLDLRPPGRMHARRSGPAPQRPARRPRHRPARRGVTTQAYWRQGVHRTGHDHPEKKTRKTSPPPRRQGLQPGRQPDPLQDRIESSPTSRPGESCTPATEDHRKPSRKPSPQSSDSYSPTPYAQLAKANPGRVMWDDNGNIGKRYRRQDEIGTPHCVVIDFQTLEDDTVTVRDRDTTEQKRVQVADLLGQPAHAA